MADSPIKTKESVGEMSLTVDLDQLFETKVPNDPGLREEIGQAIIDKIKERTDAGNKLGGGKFKKYSKEYIDSLGFKAHGKDKNDVNLRLTGDMLETMDIIAQSRNIVKLGWRDETQNAKAFNHQTGDTVPARPFFGLSNSEIKALKSEFADAINQTQEPAPSDRQTTRKLVDILNTLRGIESKIGK